MDKPELYILLFTDSLVNNLAINPKEEFIFYGMKEFITTNQLLIIIIASLAFTLASGLNYILGRIIFNIFKSSGSKPSIRCVAWISDERNFKYITMLLLLSWVPFFGKFLAMFAGFCRLNLVKVVAICAISKLLYYTAYILL